MTLRKLLAGMALTACFTATAAMADVCTGTCGTMGANGDVTLSPSGNASYGYVSTINGVIGAGEISVAGGYTGSELVTSPFSATAGDPLTFYFNYITSDGAEFADYAWAELQNSTGAHVAWLFTARTEPSGDTMPGTGLPANDSTLTPASTPILFGTGAGGGPVWAALGGDSGDCYDAGCGYTGWIESTYAIPTTGNYMVAYGVTNYLDDGYQSGLAFDGLAVKGVQVNPPTPSVPEPATWTLLLFGLAGAYYAFRARRRAAT